MSSGADLDAAYIARELASLEYHWGSAYLFQCPRMGLWLAYRRDDMTLIEAKDPDRLLALVRADYAARQVPRQGDSRA